MQTCSLPPHLCAFFLTMSTLLTAAESKLRVTAAPFQPGLCSDIPPDNLYSCYQQVCPPACMACFDCAAVTELDDGYICSGRDILTLMLMTMPQKLFGKCNVAYLLDGGFCAATCNRCPSYSLGRCKPSSSTLKNHMHCPFGFQCSLLALKLMLPGCRGPSACSLPGYST